MLHILPYTNRLSIVVVSAKGRECADWVLLISVFRVNSVNLFIILVI